MPIRQTWHVIPKNELVGGCFKESLAGRMVMINRTSRVDTVIRLCGEYLHRCRAGYPGWESLWMVRDKDYPRVYHPGILDQRRSRSARDLIPDWDVPPWTPRLGKMLSPGVAWGEECYPWLYCM